MADIGVLARRAAIGIAVVVVAVGIVTPMVATNDSGVYIDVVDPGTPGGARIEVVAVAPYSPAEQYGIHAGMLVTSLNGIDLIDIPEPIYPEPSPGTEGDAELAPSSWVPSRPVVRIGDVDQLLSLASSAVTELRAVDPEDLSTWTEATGFDWMETALYDDGRNSLRESSVVVAFGIAVLLGISWWLGSGRAGAGLREPAVPLALATAAPFLLDPLTTLWAPEVDVVRAVLGTLSMLPLAAALLERIDQPRDRQIAIAAVAVCATGAVVGWSVPVYISYGSSISERIGSLMAAGITVVPGLMAAGPALPSRRAALNAGGEAVAGGRLLVSAELAAVGFTPAIALLGAPVGAVALVAWAVLLAAAGRFTVRPLARIASRATHQRDLVLAATEAERARVAADIHDDALQELTLLVRRLDAAGDTEGADLARGVSDRLRAICGDLRLPILDDLGVGPALDWLVLRMERLAGGEVRLEKTDGPRPPAEVELAFFRVAQEALANAVKHGQAPITVRYRSTDGAASLSVDDAGTGIDPDAATRAEGQGHYGLMNMAQRAEAIGAILDVRRWPGGGTHVQLEWRAR